MREIGEGRGRDYGQPCLLIRGQTAVYFGRGFVQLTWLANYARMSVRLGSGAPKSAAAPQPHG